MPAHFENGKNETEAKFELALKLCRNNVKTVRNLTVKTRLQDFDAKETYLHSKNRSVSFQKRRKCSVFIILKCLQDAVSKMCRLEFRFQNLPLTKSASDKNVPF